jgi:hypothetical protein
MPLGGETNIGAHSVLSHRSCSSDRGRAVFYPHRCGHDGCDPQHDNETTL